MKDYDFELVWNEFCEYVAILKPTQAAGGGFELIKNTYYLIKATTEIARESGAKLKDSKLLAVLSQYHKLYNGYEKDKQQSVDEFLKSLFYFDNFTLLEKLNAIKNGSAICKESQAVLDAKLFIKAKSMLHRHEEEFRTGIFNTKDIQTEIDDILEELRYSCSPAAKKLFKKTFERIASYKDINDSATAKSTNLYRVKAKCKFVGKDKYILVDFPVKAPTPKKAAQKVRGSVPRVKREQKDAIVEVECLTPAAYEMLIKQNANDPYLLSHTLRQQMMIYDKIEHRIKDEPKLTKREISEKSKLYDENGKKIKHVKKYINLNRHMFEENEN